MSHWNYRVLRFEDSKGKLTYQFHEVYYCDNGEVSTWTESSVAPLGESCSELLADVEHFLAAFRKPTLKAIERNGDQCLVEVSEEQEGNAGHFSEVVDRIAIVLEHCVDAVGSHPVIRRHPELQAIFKKAEDAMTELYEAAAKCNDEKSGF